MIQQTTRGVPRLDLGRAFLEYVAGQTGFVTAQVFPLFSSPLQAAKFLKVTREGLLRMEDSKRKTGGNYNRIDLYTEDDEFACEEHGLEGRLPDDQRRLYATDFNAEVAKTQQIAHILLLNQEYRTAALLWDPTTNWPSTNAALYTDVSAAPWDAAGSDVIGHVIAAMEVVRGNTGMRPNALVVSGHMLSHLLANTAIQARYKSATTVTRQMIEADMVSIFGLEKLIVGDWVYNSAAEGAAFSGADIWSDDYALVALVANPGDPLDTPCVGRTILWTGDSPQSPVIEVYREEQTRSDIIRGRHSVDEKLLDPYFAHLLKVDA